MCRKCWRDAGITAAVRGTSKADEYAAIIDERADSPCTPEEQAGEDATECPACARVAVHEVTGECMVCGLETKEVAR